MDRDSLQAMLGEGLSLAEIGRRSGRHEATVAYWVSKHGLVAAHKTKHAAKGRLERHSLEPLVENGLSVAQIAERVGRSRTTVRHWLREYGLETVWAVRRQASHDGRPRLLLRCATHGVAPFDRQRNGGYRCRRCVGDAVQRRRREVKRVLVEEAGGCCTRCGYDRCLSALEFHHVVPAQKSFTLSHRGVARSLEKARAEAEKCQLLCANCHAEVEAQLRTGGASAPSGIE